MTAVLEPTTPWSGVADPNKPANVTTESRYERLLRSVDLEALATELDAVRLKTLADLGDADEEYLRRVIRVQRALDLAGRGALWAGPSVPTWVLGSGMLGLAKILENMEIGHNILHGQWDWLDDPDIHSTTWEWDHACPSSQWKHSHNQVHHQWTNIDGIDNDIGYDVFRVHDEQRHYPMHEKQPAVAVALALLFEYGIAFHDIEGLGLFGGGRRDLEAAQPKLNESLAKIRRQATKDFVAFPALSLIPFGPAGVLSAASGAVAANVMRNLWSFAVIFCGHFPDDVEMFPKEAANDQRQGAWYLRQILGSANFEGGRLLHVLTGNLDHQIEHHLFPDLPSNRYSEIAPQVQAICERHEIPYNTGSFSSKLSEVARKIWRLRRP